MSDVWQGPEDQGDATKKDGEPAKTNGKRDPMEVYRRIWAYVSANPSPWLMAAATTAGFVFVAVMLSVGVLIASMIAAAPVADAFGEDAAGLTVLAGFGLYTFILVVFGLVANLMSASLVRAVDQHRISGEGLGLMSPFSTMFQDAGRVLLFSLVGGLATFIGMLFCYIPGFVVAAVMLFAFPRFVLGGETLMEAVSNAWSHMQQEVTWHLAVFLLAIALNIVLQTTLIGLFFIMPAYALVHVFAYRVWEEGTVEAA